MKITYIHVHVSTKIKKKIPQQIIWNQIHSFRDYLIWNERKRGFVYKPMYKVKLGKKTVSALSTSTEVGMHEVYEKKSNRLKILPTWYIPWCCWGKKVKKKIFFLSKSDQFWYICNRSPCLLRPINTLQRY